MRMSCGTCCLHYFSNSRLKETIRKQPKEWPYAVRQAMKHMNAEAAAKVHKVMKQCCEVFLKMQNCHRLFFFLSGCCRKG